MRAIERTAAKVLGHSNGWVPDQFWLSASCLDYLAHEVGEVTVAMSGEDWKVTFVDHDAGGKRVTMTGVTMPHALSMAVVFVGKIRGDLNPPMPYEEFRKELDLT